MEGQLRVPLSISSTHGDAAMFIICTLFALCDVVYRLVRHCPLPTLASFWEYRRPS